MEEIKGDFVQKFWRFTIMKKVGDELCFLFRTESLTVSVDVDKIRKELLDKFKDGYVVSETQWNIIKVKI